MPIKYWNVKDESQKNQQVPDALVGQFGLMFTGFVLEQKKIYFSMVTWLTAGLHLRFGWIINFYLKIQSLAHVETHCFRNADPPQTHLKRPRLLPSEHVLQKLWLLERSHSSLSSSSLCFVGCWEYVLRNKRTVTVQAWCFLLTQILLASCSYRKTTVRSCR